MHVSVMTCACRVPFFVIFQKDSNGIDNSYHDVLFAANSYHYLLVPSDSSSLSFD